MSGAAMAPTAYPGMLPPKQIVNGYSANGWTAMPPPVGGGINGIPGVNPGAMTAGVLTQVVNLTGPGVLEFMAVMNTNATARTLRMQLVIDGVTVLDATSGVLGATGVACLAGAFSSNASGNHAVAYDALPFTSSCVLSIASSLTESNPFIAYSVSRTV